MSDDYTNDTSTEGTVVVGGTATGNIETDDDFDWFRVELVAGRTYEIDLEGFDSGGGTLDSTVLRGLYDSEGRRITGTQTNSGGAGDDARLTFTASQSGTYYIAARGHSNETGTYTVRVTEIVADDARADAQHLGSITNLGGPRFAREALDGSADSVAYFTFTLSEAKEVGLGLRQQDADADLFLEDAEGNVLRSSTKDGRDNEWISETLLEGTYYVRVEAQEAGDNDFKLRYGVGDPDQARVTQLEAAREEESSSDQAVPPQQAPVFASEDYRFPLAENADGSTEGVALGAVAATDPEGEAVSYSIVGGNGDGLFAIDPSTGALSYVGAGEDHESGTTSHELTVRASDDELHSEVTVTVEVTDVNEAPAFGQASYAFQLAENADGSTEGVALGAVEATDPEGGTVSYSIVGGNGDGLFAIDAGTGALSYVGAGEDYESGTKSHALTVRASDGTLNSDVAVTVNVTDVDEQSVVEGAEGTDEEERLPARGPVITVQGEVEEVGRTYQFAVELSAGRRYVIDVKGKDTGDGTLQRPILYGLFAPNGTKVPFSDNVGGGVGDNARTVRTVAETGTYNVKVGSSRYESPDNKGTFTLVVTHEANVDDTRQGARDLGDITDVEGTKFPRGELEEGFDHVDYYTFTLTEPRRVSLGLRQQDADADLVLEDADGNVIATSRQEGDGNEDLTQALLAGTYYVRVEGQEDADNRYVLRHRTEEVDEETPRIEVQDAQAYEEAGSEIVFKVVLSQASAFPITVSYRTQDGDAKAGQDYVEKSGDLTFAPGETEKTVPVSVLDDDIEDSGETFRLVIENPSYGELADAQATGTIRNTDEYPGGRFPGDDYGESPGTAGSVAVGSSTTGMLTKHPASKLGIRDSDWFAVELEGNKVYRVKTDGVNNRMALHAVYDSDGNLVQAGLHDLSVNNNWDRDSNIIVPYTGTFYLEVSRRETTPADLGQYTVSVSENHPSADTVSGWIDTTGAVAVGGSVRNKVDFAHDVDWFAVELEADQLYRIDLEGDDTDDGTLGNPRLAGIFDSDGNRISGTSDTYGGELANARVFFTPDTAGTYYIAARGAGIHRGTYTLSVTEKTDRIPGDTDTNARVRVGGSRRSEVEFPDDQDWFEVRLVAGTTYQIYLDGYAGRGTNVGYEHSGRFGSDPPTLYKYGTLRDAYLYGIHDSDGTLIPGTTDDNSGWGFGSQVEFTPTESGTYYIAAGSYGNQLGSYTVSVEVDGM